VAQHHQSDHVVGTRAGTKGEVKIGSGAGFIDKMVFQQKVYSSHSIDSTLTYNNKQ
jgi:hypothetical protein